MIFISFLIAAITAAGFALNLPWLQVIFLLYLTSVIHFALIILEGAYKYKSMKLFAAVVARDKAAVMDLPAKEVVIRFVSYDVLFACMLIYLDQTALAVIYLSAHALIHFYFALLSKLEKNSPQ